MTLLDRFIWLVVGFPIFWLSTMLHELAHVWAAYALGDRAIHRRWLTAFDPRLYVDTLGSVLFGLTWLLGAGFFWNGLHPVGFGWSKSVEYAPGAFRSPQWGTLLVALAGPVCNLGQAILWYALAQWLNGLAPAYADIAMIAASTNLVLATFNLIPLPPLDGATILANLLSRRGAVYVENIQPGIVFLLLWIGLSLPPIAALVLKPALWLAGWISHWF